MSARNPCAVLDSRRAMGLQTQTKPVLLNVAVHKNVRSRASVIEAMRCCERNVDTESVCSGFKKTYGATNSNTTCSQECS